MFYSLFKPKPPLFVTAQGSQINAYLARHEEETQSNLVAQCFKDTKTSLKILSENLNQEHIARYIRSCPHKNQWTHIDLSDSQTICDLKFLSECGSLQYLKLNTCARLESLQGLETLHLKEVCAKNCKRLEDLSAVCRPGVVSLNFSGCEFLQAHHARSVQKATDLQRLCFLEVTFPKLDLKGLTHLTEYRHSII